MRGGATIVGGMALCLAGGEAGAGPRGRPYQVDGEIGLVAFFSSAYRDSLREFGQNGPNAGFQLALRGLWAVGADVRAGFRLGYLVSGASSATTLPDAAEGARAVGNVWFHLIDAGAVLRLVVWRSDRPARRPMSVAFDAEAGGVVALTEAIRGDAVGLRPRFAVSARLAFPSDSAFQVGLRVGAQFVPSGGASGGSWWDPAFAGVTVGFELGGGR